MLGGINDEKMRFLNGLEKPWYEGFRRTSWIPCDQLLMAVVLDESCVAARQTYWVRSCVIKNMRRSKYLLRCCRPRWSCMAKTPEDKW